MKRLREIFLKSSSKYSLMTWIVFISTIMFTTIVISVVLYQNFERVTLNTITSLNHELSIQADSVSNHIQEVIEISGMQTFYNPLVSRLRQAKMIKNFDVIAGIRELNAFASSNPYVHSVYVYNGRQDCIYATSDSVSDNSIRFKDQDAVKLFKNCKPEDRLTPIFRTINKPNSDGVQNVYTYIMYELNSDGKSIDNGLIINIYSDWISQVLLQTDSGSNTLIIDKSGNMIANSMNSIHDIDWKDRHNIKNILVSNNGNGYFIDSSRPEKMLYIYSKLNCNDWYLFRIAPYSECMQGLSELKEKTLSIIMLIFLMGAGISLIMLMRIYIPFNKMLHSIAKVNNESSEDMNSILKNLDFIVENALDTAQTKESYASLLKSEFLKQLLKDPVPQAENIKQNFKMYNIHLDLNNPITFLMVCGDRLDEYMKIIRDIATQAIVEGIFMNGDSILLLQSVDIDSLHYICGQIHSISNCNLVAYSKPIYEIRNLKKCYNRMCEVISFHIFYPDCPVLSESILDNKLEDNIYPVKLESDLISALKGGKSDQAKKKYDLILATMLNYRYNTIMFTFKRLYLTVLSLYKNLFGQENDESLPSTIEALDDKFNMVHNFDEITAIFFYMFDCISKQVEYNKQSRNVRLIEQLKSRIKNSYSDPNLSPQSLADEIGISCSYLGKLFHSFEGISISEYIKQVRIEQAKHLLCFSNFSIKDIANQIGFANIQYFYTLFKKNTQKTPREYRFVMRKDVKD
ncbi:MAG TPA: hypothetical protein DD429_10960 [Clostridiaceae bacterium]|nr:hypothetical protein [Clostridiaceae bacterium]